VNRISFSTLSKEASESLICEARATLGDECAKTLAQILSSFDCEGCDVGVCLSGDILFVRVFDGGEYFFVYPFALREGSDLEGGLISLSEYAKRELIPLRLTDVPRDELDLLSKIFPFVNASAYEDDEDAFFVRIHNELSRLDRAPCVEKGDLTLSPIDDSDGDFYFELCHDEENNKYWGYDYREDNPEADKDYFLAVARGELVAGVALSLAVKHSGDFVGEAVLYGFDFLGGAEVGVRILPRYQGLGLGKRSLAALIELARKIKLKRLYASVMEENKVSCKMTEKLMKKTYAAGGRVNFLLEL
jgi:RimJ/RimL family protein N-acetyltransferase